MREPSTDEGYEMFEYEIQQMRAAEMIRAADDYRLAREAVRGRRAARRASGENDGAEGRMHTRHPRRHRFARAA
ncbi:hypothetical protein ACFY93_30705 [Streptomyces sp. NPDC008313]|uniref:hypothetical protein n=1 Tax=Streptomyces sp. NPDC008313 TaxID=3364826 RepID=UPI0036DFDBEC